MCLQLHWDLPAAVAACAACAAGLGRAAAVARRLAGKALRARTGEREGTPTVRVRRLADSTLRSADGSRPRESAAACNAAAKPPLCARCYCRMGRTSLQAGRCRRRHHLRSRRRRRRRRRSRRHRTHPFAMPKGTTTKAVDPKDEGMRRRRPRGVHACNSCAPSQPDAGYSTGTDKLRLHSQCF
jgi:hypothetical protein